MVRAPYVPDRGYVVWVSLDAGTGYEQSGRRPALIISPRVYNVQSGLAIACPITSHVKGYPFEVMMRPATVRGAVLADQLRSIDWQARKIQYAGSIAPEALREVQEKLRKLIE